MNLALTFKLNWCWGRKQQPKTKPMSTWTIVMLTPTLCYGTYDVL